MAARWYVLHVYSGFEAKVAESIRDKAKKQGLEERIEDILIPTEEVVEIKRGQRVNTEQKSFPGMFWPKWICRMMFGTWLKIRRKLPDFLGQEIARLR